MHFRCLFIAVVFLSLPARTCPEGSHSPFPETQEEDQPSAQLIEKVYLHLDRYNYLTGEDIWYKAYLVDAMRNKLSDHSKTLYVELVSPGLVILDRKMIRLEMGTGAGDFHLDNSLPTGTYLIRAYTNWIRNFGNDFIFHKEIRILNSEYPDFPSVNQFLVEQDTIDVQFFPEGGSLVAGVPSRVGFKAVDQHGNGCRVEGLVATRDGDTWARIESTHLGMGSFKSYLQKVPVTRRSFPPITDLPYDLICRRYLRKGMF